MRERVLCFCRHMVSTDLLETAVTAQYTVAARFATLTAMSRYGPSCTACKRRGRAAARMRASRVFGFCRQVVSTDLRRTAVTAQYTCGCAMFHAHGNMSTRCKLHDMHASLSSGRKNAGKSRFWFL